MSKQWERRHETLQGFRILRIGLAPERQMLYQRINQRVQQMFAAGLVEETRALLEDYGESARPLESTGYKQVVQHLRGEINAEAAISAVQQAHRNYAKKQMTWFRREPDVHWLKGFGDETASSQKAAELVQQQL